MLIPRSEMLDILWGKNLIQRRLVGRSRWAVHYEIIFKYQDKFYRTEYSEGATEQQEESPWEFQSEVRCEEVVQVEKLVTVWELFR